MPDYQKGKIYKLYSVSNEELVYYGSTIETLSRRLSKHVYDYKNNSGCTSKKVIAVGDYKIELVENYPCFNKQALERREGEFTKNNMCVNKIIAGRTKKEYLEDNKEKIKEWQKEWREDNKEHKKQYDKELYQNNKEAIAEKAKKWREDNKQQLTEKKKEYYQNNKEQIVEKAKKYREDNKEQISEKGKKKVTCECGCIIRKDGLAEHKRSNKHLELMNN